MLAIFGWSDRAWDGRALCFFTSLTSLRSLFSSLHFTLLTLFFTSLHFARSFLHFVWLHLTPLRSSLNSLDPAHFTLRHSLFSLYCPVWFFHSQSILQFYNPIRSLHSQFYSLIFITQSEPCIPTSLFNFHYLARVDNTLPELLEPPRSPSALSERHS